MIQKKGKKTPILFVHKTFSVRVMNTLYITLKTKRCETLEFLFSIHTFYVPTSSKSMKLQDCLAPDLWNKGKKIIESKIFIYVQEPGKLKFSIYRIEEYILDSIHNFRFKRSVPNFYFLVILFPLLCIFMFITSHFFSQKRKCVEHHFSSQKFLPFFHWLNLEGQSTLSNCIKKTHPV